MQQEPLKVTPAAVEAMIKSEFYFTAGQGVLGASEMGMKPAGRADSLNRLTFCVLVLENGFTVTGQSACVDYAAYDKTKGEEAARNKAVAQVWELAAYGLHQQRYDVNNAPDQ